MKLINQLLVLLLFKFSVSADIKDHVMVVAADSDSSSSSFNPSSPIKPYSTDLAPANQAADSATTTKKDVRHISEMEIKSVGRHLIRRTTPAEANNADAAKGKRNLGPNPGKSKRLKRYREHEYDDCDMTPFLGAFVYQNGCNDEAWRVIISCEKKGGIRGEERRGGLACSYSEETLVSDLCNMIHVLISYSVLIRWTGYHILHHIIHTHTHTHTHS